MIKTLSQKKIYEGKVVTIYQDEVEIINKKQKTTFDYVCHLGGVCVLAEIEQDQFLLVEQYRYGIKDYCLELVAGKLEKDETPLDAIKRELLEETGYEGYNWQYIGEYYPSPAYLSEVIHCYYCKAKYIQTPQLDANEELVVVKKNKSELLDLLNNNKIKYLKTLAVIYKYFSNK